MTTPKLDTVMCVHRRDIGYLFEFALDAYIEHYTPKGDLYIVTDHPPMLQAALARLGLGGIATVLDDRELLSGAELRLPGWFRQQIIKLRSPAFCATPQFCSLGSDTVLLRPVTRDDLLDPLGKPYLYYHRLPKSSSHTRYERTRVEAVAELLGVQPRRALEYLNFVFDLFCFQRAWLLDLQAYLADRYGPDCLLRLLEGRADARAERARFGEWSLYAVYLLDVFGAPVAVRCSAGRYLRQVYRQDDLRRFDFDCKVVHFVDKGFDVGYIAQRLRRLGLVRSAAS